MQKYLDDCLHYANEPFFGDAPYSYVEAFFMECYGPLADRFVYHDPTRVIRYFPTLDMVDNVNMRGHGIDRLWDVEHT